MALTLDEVRRIASLARLRLTAAEEARFLPQLDRIVAHIDQLAGYASAAPPEASEGGPEAADLPGPTLDLGWVLDNAPETMDAFLVVPSVKGGTDV